jgi:hypothetical protein
MGSNPSAGVPDVSLIPDRLRHAGIVPCLLAGLLLAVVVAVAATGHLTASVGEITRQVVQVAR